MDVQSISLLGEIMVKVTGPLLIAIIVIIYLSVYLRTGKLPSPPEALFLYARLNLARGKHVGMLVYCFIAGIVVFLSAVCILIYANFIV